MFHFFRTYFCSQFYYGSIQILPVQLFIPAHAQLLFVVRDTRNVHQRHYLRRVDVVRIFLSGQRNRSIAPAIIVLMSSQQNGAKVDPPPKSNSLKPFFCERSKNIQRSKFGFPAGPF